MPTVNDAVGAVLHDGDVEREAVGYLIVNVHGVALRLVYRVERPVALDAVDGKTVTWEADEKQRVWESFSPVVRDLLATGFLRYCLPTPGQRANFLASVKIRFPNGG